MPAEGNAVLTEALQLSGMGIPVHWLRRPGDGGKFPVRFGWERAPWQSPRELRATYRAGYNLGIHTGLVDGASVNLVALDLDSLEELLKARGAMPHTPLRVVTRRGEHWYYLHPGEGCIVPTRHKPDRRAIDVNAQLAQVVCPPSTHVSGHVYSWVVRPSAELLRQVPVWNPAWFRRRKAPAAVASANHIVGIERDRAVRRGRGFARKWRVAVESEGRGTQTYLLALTLVNGLQLDSETAYQVLASEWNPRLSEPYTEDLLRRKVAEAQKAQHARAQLR